MIKVEKYLDHTYLKTPEQAGISREENDRKVENLVQECIDYRLLLAMVRPEYVKTAKEMIRNTGADVLVGTVIGFPEGIDSTEDKLCEAAQAIEDGADELDFVCNYPAYQQGNEQLLRDEIFKGTQQVLKAGKKIKWIIETAALSPEQIAGITRLIRDVVLYDVKAGNPNHIFVKSSTGFYKTPDNSPSGATPQAMKIILEHARPLSVKAAGGVRSYKDALMMIEMGVDRIGTSSAVKIVLEADNG